MTRSGGFFHTSVASQRRLSYDNWRPSTATIFVSSHKRRSLVLTVPFAAIRPRGNHGKPAADQRSPTARVVRGTPSQCSGVGRSKAPLRRRHREGSSLMETLFALVLTVAMTNGDYQDVILGVYDSQQECSQAASEQKVSAECWPVESILRNGEFPAKDIAQH